MEFEVHTIIHRPPDEVFSFFRNMHQQPRRKGSVGPVYEKITPGSVGVGTRYRELVRLLPFLKGEVISEITGYDPPSRLDYRATTRGRPAIRPELCRLSLRELSARVSAPFS